MNDYPFFVGITIARGAKAYYFGTDIEDLSVGELVVVDTSNGMEMGTVATNLMSTDDYRSSLLLKPVLRRANKTDLANHQYNKRQEKIALEIAAKEIERLGLGMNLIDANYTLDGSKITITYTADARVDFRELLRILAPELHARIELRQIAPRDKAKIVGGLGVCGLPLCCATFLSEFEGIAITRAKNQMLALNTQKLSGQCGKLMCCLAYEDDLYTEAKKDFPRIGTVVHMGSIEYTVDSYNILSRTVKLTSPTDVTFVSLEDYGYIAKGRIPPKKEEKPVQISPKENEFSMDAIPVNEDRRPKENPNNNRDNRQNNNNNNRRDNRNNQNQGNRDNRNNNNNNGGNRHFRHRHHHYHGGNGNNNGQR